MPSAYKLLFFVSLSIFLSACQTVVRTDIETFRNESASFDKGTIRVVPVDKKIPETLEFRHFKSKLEQRLSAIGYRPVDDGPADFRAKLGYGVSRQEKDRPNSRVFLGGQLGYHGYYNHSGVLFADSLGPEFEYVREVTLAIDKNSAGESEAAEKDAQVIQVMAASVGRCGHLSVVYDEMLDAIFANLMRSDGSIERVKVKGDSNCS